MHRVLIEEEKVDADGCFITIFVCCFHLSLIVLSVLVSVSTSSCFPPCLYRSILASLRKTCLSLDFILVMPLLHLSRLSLLLVSTFGSATPSFFLSFSFLSFLLISPWLHFHLINSALSAYMFFVNSNRESVITKNPGIGFGE